MRRRATQRTLEVPVQKNLRNRVLASLSDHDKGRLAPHLAPVTLQRNQRLHDAGQVIDIVYFLEDGVCSTVVTMESGRTVEVGAIGRDGKTLVTGSKDCTLAVWDILPTTNKSTLSCHLFAPSVTHLSDHRVNVMVAEPFTSIAPVDCRV